MITNGTFCYWDAKSDIDSYILLFNLVVTGVLLGVAIYYANLFRKTNSMQLVSSKQIYIKFICVVLWAISYQATVIFGLVVYWGEFRGRDGKDLASITGYSKVYAFIETIPAMIVQTLLFTTAKQMISNGMGFLLEQQQQPSKKQRKIYTIIERYYWLRLVFLVSWVLVLFPFDDVNIYEIVTRVKILLLMLDCGIIVGLLKYCHNYMLDRPGALLANNGKERKKLYRETTLLTICGVCRFIMDLTFYIIFPFVFATMESSVVKPCIEEAKDHLQFTIGYLVLGTYLLHHISIATILKIFKPSPN